MVSNAIVNREPAGGASSPNAPCHRKVASHWACVLDSSGAIVVDHLRGMIEEKLESLLFQTPDSFTGHSKG